MKTNMIYKIPLPPVFLCPPPPLFPPPIQSGGRRNFSNNARRQQQQQQQQQQQNSANSMMQQHGGHGQQDSLPSHCVSPMSQGAGVSSQSVPDPHQVSSRTNAGESVALLELCVCVCVCVCVCACVFWATVFPSRAVPARCPPRAASRAWGARPPTNTCPPPAPPRPPPTPCSSPWCLR